MYKLDLEKAEEIINITGSQKKQGNSQKTSTFASLTTLKTFVDHNKLWKILLEMGIPDYLTCLLRNLYAHQEATVRTRHGTTNCFQIRKGVSQGCILSPCSFNLHAVQEETVRSRHGKMNWFQIGKGLQSRLYIFTLLIYLICRVHHEKCWTG